MTSIFEYDCEAVRVRAKRILKSGEEEHRKFSVDPNLTSYDILKSILTRAFDVSGDFAIYFSSSGDWMAASVRLGFGRGHFKRSRSLLDSHD